MKYKDLMIEALTGMLKDGETLMHPIYGIMNQGNIQYYGYFGFTENDLLIALVSGKQITYTIRIPLDIKSIKIKKTLVFRQYVIDIGFNDGDHCNITAAQKVLMIDSQKDNLPLFLSYLKSKSPQNKSTELKDIVGEKIRWQYFNTFTYVMLSFSPAPILIILILELKNGNFDFEGLIEIMLTSLIMWGVFLAPLIFLSIINRLLFGKIVSVVNDEMLFLENDNIPLKYIQKIVYNPRIGSKYKISYTSATVVVDLPNKEETIMEITVGISATNRIVNNPFFPNSILISGLCFFIFLSPYIGKCIISSSYSLFM